jgi:hypothetical protein
MRALSVESRNLSRRGA